MPVAAVPAYLGNDFAHASPGLRFGLLLPIWTDRRDQEKEINDRASARSPEGEELAALLKRDGMDATIRRLREPPRPRIAGLWEKNDFAAREAWKRITAISVEDKKRMVALVRRQAFAAERTPHLLRLDAVAVAPFTTGLGNEHPLENGFAFLNPYGLPYLPGSGVKGVVRRASQELAGGMWDNDRGWKGLDRHCYRLEIRRGKETVTIPLSVLDVLFGLESGAGDTEHVRGALSFWDVIPQIKGNSLMVEIMTPHQSHYYQINKKQNPQPPHFQSPHDSGQPNPISFLTVPPGSTFTFYVVCDVLHLRKLCANRQDGAPDLVNEVTANWKNLLRGAFEHAFEWMGFGAKTAVGYGAMREAGSKPAESREPKKARTEAPGAETLVWETAKLLWNRGSQELRAVSGSERTAPVKGMEKARALFSDPAIFDRLLKKGEHSPVRVEVAKEGNYIELKRVL